MVECLCVFVRVYDDYNDHDRVQKLGESGVIGPGMMIPLEYVDRVKSAMDQEFKGRRGVKGSTREGEEKMHSVRQDATEDTYLQEFRSLVDAYLTKKGM